MGIKNLKKLLTKNKSLVLVEDGINRKYDGVFVDTMSIYVAVANCYTNMDDLTNVFRKYIQKWIKIGNTVTLFIDKGTINIKEPIRDKRRENSKLTRERKRKDLENIKLEIDKVKDQELMADEIITDMQLKMNKLAFQLYLLDSNNIKTSLKTILSTLDDQDNNITTIYCDNKDAEFVMCLEARKQFSDRGTWPLIVSTDQDTMLFTSVDRHPKMIKTLTQLFRFIPTAEDEYLSKLAVLINGCDFFPGLYGSSLTTDNLDKIKLFSEFTLDNILTSLVFKNYYKRPTTNDTVDVYKIINFINNYANLEDVYSEDTPLQCTIQDFIFSALKERWDKFKESYLSNIPLPCQLMYALTPRKNINEYEVKQLVSYIDFENTKSDINIIKSIAFIFGYSIEKSSNVKVFGIYNKLLLLTFNNSFYFNNTLVNSNIKSDNIIDIGYY
ncbi:FEN1-like nuclease [NY_014 poxvirus]|uniref:FEN1-like nuclease n=1 Tax=NY_014 poxvirus TaxID=2025360 RepID=UPI000B9A06D2|nr:FEN1-like nuclease [NY_014 poxvirus]AST09475.1 FEN1-like nuclease [NY_014 poxvirus]